VSTYTLRPEDLGAHIVRREDERKKAALHALQDTVFVRGHQIAQEEVARTEPPPVDRGEYKAKFKVYNTRTGAVFTNIAKHAGVIEKGRRPGTWPPRFAIEQWVKRKFRVRYGPNPSGNWLKGLAFVIARKIARRGIKGRNIMARVEARLSPEVQAAVRTAMSGGGHQP